MISVRAQDTPGLHARLAQHPFVALEPGDPVAALEFGDRSLRSGSREGLRGLVELTDNNPMVCSSTFSVPDASATLALIALGPLVRAGLLVEPPTLLFSFHADPAAVNDHLGLEGWSQGATTVVSEGDLGSVRALNALAVVATPTERLEELDDLYEEAFGRSFFVRRDETSSWDPSLVQGQNFACYRLGVTPDEPYSLLSIKVLADAEGKCGAGQLVHAFNVMNGFEESLGL